MIVEFNALCFRLPRVSCRLSATRPKRFYAITIPPRRAYAVRIASNYKRDTILQASDHSPASTCWSLLSPSSPVIASNLPSLKLRKAKSKSGKTPLVVLLVTPAHIQLLDGDSAFIPSLLQLAVEQTKPRQEFDLLAAVVDRIPQTSSTTSHRLQGSHAADVDVSPKTRVEDGSEGISVAILDSEAAAPDLWSPRNMSNERETVTIQQRATLAFSLPPSPGMRTNISDKSASQPLVKRVLQLPVANTLFQNGRTSTLFAQKWVLSFGREPTSENLSSEKTWLPQQTVHMDAIFADEGMRLQLDTLVRSHLVPVTPARTITAAVGNIVRELSGGDNSAEAAPASEELERAISTAIQQGQIPAQQAGVWALIRPQRYAALDRPAQIEETVRDMVGYAILSGARLHRVLSGGGGWGEKHGLLALDPDSDYSYHHREFGPSLGNGQDSDVKNFGALGEVAKLGDIITFYVYRSPSDADPANLRAPVFPSSSEAVTATVVFGSLPSTVDAMPEVDITEAEGHTQSELTVEKNHFGMLSEQGMNLESSFLNTNITANRMQYLRPELHKQIYKVRHRKIATTKLDTPYTTVSIRGRISRISVSNEVKRKELQSLNVHLQDLMPPESPTVTTRTKPVAALVQKLPRDNDRKEESQRLIGQEDPQAYRVLAKSQVRVEEDGGKLTRKEKSAIKIQALEAQSKTARERQRTIAEAEVISKANPAIPQNLAWNIARKAMREVVKQRGEDRSKTNDDSPLKIRFTSQKQEPYREVTLEPKPQDAPPQDAPPVTIRRYLAVSDDFSQKHRPASEQDFHLGTEQGRKSFPDDPDSVPIIREESEGKDPGTAHRGKEGNIFVVRKHYTMNPFERLQAIQEVGELSSRENAMGLHGEYHLVLDGQPEENAEVLDEKL